MKRSNYNEISDHIIANEPFEGNTMCAKISGTGTYIVYSYKLPIYMERDGKCIHWVGDKYSRTTSRHQGIVRHAKEQKIVELQNHHSQRSGLTYSL